MNLAIIHENSCTTFTKYSRYSLNCDFILLCHLRNAMRDNRWFSGTQYCPVQRQYKMFKICSKQVGRRFSFTCKHTLQLVQSVHIHNRGVYFIQWCTQRHVSSGRCNSRLSCNSSDVVVVSRIRHPCEGFLQKASALAAWWRRKKIGNSSSNSVLYLIVHGQRWLGCFSNTACHHDKILDNVRCCFLWPQIRAVVLFLFHAFMADLEGVWCGKLMFLCIR